MSSYECQEGIGGRSVKARRRDDIHKSAEGSRSVGAG